MSRNPHPEHVSDILGRLADAAGARPQAPNPTAVTPAPRPAPAPDPGPPADPAAGRYDFDLAEFPLFRLNKLAASRTGRDPLRYEDTITGRDGRPVARSWAVYPGPAGFGGPSAQLLLFDLLQLYAEQGARGPRSSSAPCGQSSSVAGTGTRRAGTTTASGATSTSCAGTTSTARTRSGTPDGRATPT